MGKVLASWNELKLELNQLREDQGSRGQVVFTNGCFDILHVGHVRYLKEARALGGGPDRRYHQVSDQRPAGCLVVGLNTDESVRRLKGPNRPVQNESARAEILSSLICVDFVVLFNEETPEALIHEVRPDILVKGGDYTIDRIVGAPFVQSYGGRVCTLPFSDGHSTSSIIEKMRQE